MRLVAATVLSCCVLVASAAGGEQVFPYKGFINTDDVYVRSGPGQSYYPTAKLKKGQQVEVYRHDPGGWYAVKPPEGSFAWVARRFLKAGVDNLAVVTEDRVAARVGSRFSNIKDVIQVRLHQGEVVEVLESKRFENDPQGATWYKIAPPSGEFRWVFGKYVQRQSPHDGVRTTSGDEPSAPAEIVPAEPRRSTPDDMPPPVTVRQPDAGAWNSTPAAEPDYPPATSRGMTPEQFQAELEEIDMELSVMVIEEPTVWDFGEMHYRAESLLNQAETALERGRARVLLNKIARFGDIKRRYDRIASLRKKTERSNRWLASLGSTGREPGRTTPGDGRYDGVGELTRVVSPKLGAPRYALVGEDGGVQYYVTPAPGVNLRHYVGRRVGVNGTRGYMPEQHAHHIMAKHVRVLEDRRFR